MCRNITEQSKQCVHFCLKARMVLNEMYCVHAENMLTGTGNRIWWRKQIAWMKLYFKYGKGCHEKVMTFFRYML